MSDSHDLPEGELPERAAPPAPTGGIAARAMAARAPRAPDYLDGLNAEQRAAVETTEGPVLVLAGAGTGKTRVLTTRIAHILATGRAYPSQILAVTFTNKAAREMRNRIGLLVGAQVEGMPWLGTFHSIGVKILRRHAELAGLKSNFTILDTDDQIRLIKQLIQAENLDDKRWPARTFAGMLDGWKNKGLTPKDIPEGDARAFANGRGRELYAAYQARLKSLNACDFGDLLLHPIALFRAHPDVLADYHRRFRYILVDEYQDTNTAQYMWLRLLAQRPQPRRDAEASLSDPAALPSGARQGRTAVAPDGAPPRSEPRSSDRVSENQPAAGRKGERPSAGQAAPAERSRASGDSVSENQKQQINICCVGDDDQSIYGWRGAEVDNILRFDRDFPGATVIRLERNYRSTAHILGAASHLIAHNEDRLGKTLYTDFSDPEHERVQVNAGWDSEEEARAIGEEIEQLQRKSHKLNDMAILVRASFQMREFEDRFVTLGLNYRVIGGPRFYERMEVRDALAYFRATVQPADDLAFERIVNTPKRGLGDATIRLLHDYARKQAIPLIAAADALTRTEELKPKVRATLRTIVDNFARWAGLLATTRHTDLAETILEESGYTEMWQNDRSAEAPGRLENLKELIRSMEEYESLPSFLEHVALVMDAEQNAELDAVSIMTLHSAKGLEFETVFLPGWEEGLFPHQRSLDEGGRSGLEEERRLAYVGITRGKRRVKIWFVSNRRIHGLWQSTIPSRFLDELPEDHVEIVEPSTSYGGYGASGFGGYGASRWDKDAFSSSSYATPGWRRAQAASAGRGSAGYGGSGGSAGGRGSGGYGGGSSTSGRSSGHGTGYGYGTGEGSSGNRASAGHGGASGSGAPGGYASGRAGSGGSAGPGNSSAGPSRGVGGDGWSGGRSREIVYRDDGLGAKADRYARDAERRAGGASSRPDGPAGGRDAGGGNHTSPRPDASGFAGRLGSPGTRSGHNQPPRQGPNLYAAARSGGPREIQGELVAKSVSAEASRFAEGDRVFHLKFGNGTVAAVEGNKLTVDFDKAGQKRVLEGFVEGV